MSSAEDILAKQQQVAAAEEKRLSILDQILESGAKDRLARLALVRKEKARSVEDTLIAAATNGKLPGKVTEAQLIALLEQLEGKDLPGKEPGTKKVVIQRRNYGFDDDDDDNDDDLM